METREFLVHASLEGDEVEAWIEAGWLKPARRGEARQFSEIDLSRAQLIQDLRGLGINDDGVSVILDLVDQLHGLRHALSALLLALSAQPHEQRRRILHQMRRTMTEGPLDAIAKLSGSRSYPENPARGSERRLT
jgi:chaperone modulatory protein CbpM